MRAASEAPLRRAVAARLLSALVTRDPAAPVRCVLVHPVRRVAGDASDDFSRVLHAANCGAAGAANPGLVAHAICNHLLNDIAGMAILTNLLVAVFLTVSCAAGEFGAARLAAGNGATLSALV